MGCKVIERIQEELGRGRMRSDPGVRVLETD